MLKKVIMPGLIAGVLMLAVSMVLNQLINIMLPGLMAEYENPSLFRPWSDPIMSLYFAHPFVLGLALAWVWDKVKGIISGGLMQRAAALTLGMFLVTTLPGMLISYSSFPVSLTMILSWTVSSVAQIFVAGLILAKING